MKATIKRFLSFDARNVAPEIYLVLGLVYLTMLVLTVASIRGRFASPADRNRWTAIVVFLPIVGMALYCFYCLRRADYEFLRSIGLFKNTSRDSKIDSRSQFGSPSN